MVHVGLELVRQPRARQMGIRARAPRAVGDLALVAVDVRHQLLRVGHRQLRGHQQHHRRQGNLRDEGLVFLRLVGKALVQELVDEHGGAQRHQQRVAIGRRLEGVVGAAHAASATPVVHQHGLAQAGRELFAQGAGRDVGRAARLVGHHQPDGFAGPGVFARLGQGRAQQARAAQSGQALQYAAAVDVRCTHVLSPWVVVKTGCSALFKSASSYYLYSNQSGGRVSTPLSRRACSSASGSCSSCCSTSRVAAPSVGGALRMGRRWPSSRYGGANTCVVPATG